MIVQVWSNLFQGDWQGAVYVSRNPETPRGKIDWIIYVGQELPRELSHDSKVPVIHIPMKDGREDEKKIMMALSVINAVRLSEENVLVACRAGISRSPVLCAAYLSWIYGKPLEICLDHVKLHNQSVQPDPQFIRSVHETLESLKGGDA